MCTPGRFRQIPTFGRDTIRRFSSNITALVQPTGHQFEDILQCALPAFEGLLPPEDNEIVMDLIFTLAMWHGLAKFRIHTEDTVGLLEDATAAMGTAIRRFKRTTCEKYYTKEIDTKSLGRKMRVVRQGRAGKQVVHRSGAKNRKKKGKGKIASKPAGAAKKKELNLETAKLHKIAHYPSDIRTYGTTDSISCQRVSSIALDLNVEQLNNLLWE